MMDLMDTKQLLKLFSIVYLQILNTKVIIVNHLLVRNIVYNLYIQCTLNNFKSTLSNDFPVHD